MNCRIRKIFVIGALLLGLLPLEMKAEDRPRLVIQIVVGSLRPEDIDRYLELCPEGGFNRLIGEGISFTNASYNYQQTTNPVALATLTTGALPTTHGVIGSHWFDYIDNRQVGLIDDKSVTGLEYHTGGGQFSPRHLIAPTLGESLKEFSPKSHVATIALEPESAVVMSGKAGMTFWMNSDHCQWRSSSYYMSALPSWVKQYNRARTPQSLLTDEWKSHYSGNLYKNRRIAALTMTRGRASDLTPLFERMEGAVELRNDYDRMCYTPVGNTALFHFAKQVLAFLEMGKDEHPDLLNICLDTPRHILEAYGPESVEAEDMFYRLDRDLSEFLAFLYAWIDQGEVVVALTAGHGTSPSYDRFKSAADRFNVPQFEMLLEAFLDARYGKGESDWVLGYENQMVWLNHNLIYEKKLSLSEIQNEAATFAMQFRGVSHALSATAMRTSYFGSGYAELMQNSFYPRRSGDVILNLMPGWIEKRDDVRSSAGSMYGYDRRVPLLLLIPGQAPQKRHEAIGMECLAPTLAHILGIPAPVASEGEALQL